VGKRPPNHRSKFFSWAPSKARAAPHQIPSTVRDYLQTAPPPAPLVCRPRRAQFRIRSGGTCWILLKHKTLMLPPYPRASIVNQSGKGRPLGRAQAGGFPTREKNRLTAQATGKGILGFTPPLRFDGRKFFSAVCPRQLRANRPLPRGPRVGGVVGAFSPSWRGGFCPPAAFFLPPVYNTAAGTAGPAGFWPRKAPPASPASPQTRAGPLEFSKLRGPGVSSAHCRRGARFCLSVPAGRKHPP